MTGELYHVLALVLIVGFLGGIRLMNSPRTAVGGNLLGALCMLAAVVLTLVKYGLIGRWLLGAALAVGVVIGAVVALKVAMVQMPQLVAVLNGLGGAASAIVAVVVLLGQAAALNLFNRLSCGLALAIGTVTLSGSMVAAGKLAGWVRQKPVVLAGRAAVTVGLLAATVGLGLAAALAPSGAAAAISLAAVLAAALFGLVMTIRVGGGDMPITISLLNSWSGLAAAVAGFAIADPLLVAVGGVVGAAGLILTQSMCRGMNRSLVEVLSGRTTVISAAPADGDADRPAAPEASTAMRQQEPAEMGPVLRAAKRAVIVPGYGMALAQAQQQVKTLMDTLESVGCEVDFAIHPVAGRMPGHMNVLLAEVEVPYEKLWELDAANDAFAQTDVVIVVGANDVVNPAAMSAEGTPIYGMPILRVTEAAKVIVCNLDTAPGYAGVENPLYRHPKTTLLLGDASETVAALAACVSQ
ncbi:MAG TPA: NAD(P)(+) transhydrogenase (Re/Si-specific) subunit beta [Phycisphaerae bacterium]|nr:NAD(P)(+) transhydrogenase (Re/Si-specific) subunit beta [Phycisphaerae bacterium]